MMNCTTCCACDGRGVVPKTRISADPRDGRYSTILIQSVDRTNSEDPPTDCIVEIQPPLNLSQAKNITLTNFQLTPGTGNINEDYRYFYIEDSVLGVQKVTVDIGFYNVAITSTGYFTIFLESAMDSVFPIGRYRAPFNPATQKFTFTNTAGVTWRFLWETAPIADKNSLISMALGYGLPTGASDTSFAVSHESPYTMNLSYPSVYRLSLSQLPTGSVSTTNFQPATFILATGTAQRTIAYFNNSQVGALIKVGEFSGCGSISTLRVKIESAVSYPPFPLNNSKNDWTMILTIREE